jgi:formate hydrogenlyase subunit 6/NADH:ubiquinone oxidoreductase subunit I
MLGEVLRHLTRRPATIAYPAVPAVSPPAFRGKVRFSGVKCNGCKLCEKDCPSGAITIDKVGEKRYQAVFQLDRCIYCGQCVDSCNRDSLEVTAEFELAALDRGSLRVIYEAPPPPPAAATPPASPSPAPAAS